MKEVYQLPPILSGSPENQLRQLRDYLVRLARQGGQTAAASGTTQISTPASRQTGGTQETGQTKTTEEQIKEIRERAAALRALIVKTAEQQAADKSELELRIESIDGLFFYIRYSPVANPTAQQMTTVPDDDTVYMGVCSTNQETAPTDPAEYVWSRILGDDALSLQIISSNGNIFKNGAIGTTLRAVVWLGDEDVTDDFDSNYFRWTRVSADTEGDAAWNQAHFGGTKTIAITPADVQNRATFFCTLN